jgi:curli biogenesis system outer membrane secretion channel CsgG
MRLIFHRLLALSFVAFLAGQPAFAQPAQTFSPPAGTGPKKTIFVGVFEAVDIMGGQETGEGLSAMLTDALVKDGRFVVVERAAFTDIQAEQQIGTQGMTTQETAAKSGQMIGANLIVRGAVTKFGPQAGGGSLNIGGLGGFGNTLGLSRTTEECTIALRIIDSTTGQVISSSTADGEASSNGVTADFTKGGMEFGGQAFNNSPMGQAAGEAIQKAVRQIALVAANTPWSALVADNAEGQVYITAGTDANMQTGTTLHVYHRSRTVTDPSTGVVLDTLYDPVGTIQITQVRDKISIASVSSGSPPQRGDVVKLQ